MQSIPVNDERIPIWISDYVLMGYGTGAIMAVPAHDERDYEFAKKFGLEIREVISTDKGIATDASIGEGTMVNSGEFTGMPSAQGRKKIVEWMEAKGHRPRHSELQIARLGVFAPKILGRTHSDRGLRESAVWLRSMRRISPSGCPMSNDIEPTGTGESPLAAIAEWVNTKCPKCGKARQSVKPTRCRNGQDRRGISCDTRLRTRPMR